MRNKAFCAVILKQPEIKHLSGLADFENRCNLIYQMDLKNNYNLQILNVLGYYIAKHYGLKNLVLDDYQNTQDNPTLHKLFKINTIKNIKEKTYTENEVKYLVSVQRWYINSFKKYLSRIYNKTRNDYIDKIRNQITPEERDTSMVERYIMGTYSHINDVCIFENHEYTMKNIDYYEASMYILNLYMFNENRGWKL